jgi:hypothetical protein
MTVRRPANPPTRPPATEIALEQLGRRAGNGSFKEIQLVEDALHILDSERQMRGMRGSSRGRPTVLESRSVGRITTKP